jgi:copper oxidase (laccase) domain-containing protein
VAKIDSFALDKQTGLASFPQLGEEFGVTNYITYSNDIWGNMNPHFAKNKEEEKVIALKDRKLADACGTRSVLVATMPEENTLLYISPQTQRYFDAFDEADDAGYRFVPVRANGVLVTAPSVEVVFAPRDCAILIFVREGWEGFAALHLGASGAVQGAHHELLSYLKGLWGADGASNLTVFATPYICPAHYTVDGERREKLLRIRPDVEPFLAPAVVGGASSQAKERRWEFDFMGIVKKDLETKWGINRIVESGVCNYETAKKGNLFSYTLSKEDEKRFSHAGFNVAVCRQKV